MTFGLMLATVLLITHVKKQRNRSAKNEINAFKSQQVQFQNHRNCSLSTAQTFGHFNSYSFKFNSGIRNHVHNRCSVKQPYCEHDYVPQGVEEVHSECRIVPESYDRGNNTL